MACCFGNVQKSKAAVIFCINLDYFDIDPQMALDFLYLFIFFSLKPGKQKNNNKEKVGGHVLKSHCETRMESRGALALHDLGRALTQEEEV